MSKKSSPKVKVHYFLNAPIITEYGLYEFRPYNPEIDNLDLSESISAIGHESTAKYLTQILKYPVKINRIEVKMKLNECALVFALKKRIKEGKVLSFKELRELEYQIGLLTRIK